MNARNRAFAVEVVVALRNAGHQALFAGGCVRDLLLGDTPSDFDVATDATPERVLGLFKRTTKVGISFGVVRVIGPKDAGEVEVATFRSDGVYLDGRHPESVTFGSAEADASRRDFTINGMFLDPLTNEVIDYVGGRHDLERKTIRAIGNPVARFEEDKLRLLRAIRFASRFDFEIDPATRVAIEQMSAHVNQVAVERISHELDRMLTHPNRVAAIALARDVGLLDAILPEVASLIGDERWERTMRVLDALPESPSLPLSMAALLHQADSECSRGTADAVSRRLKRSNSEREKIVWLVDLQDILLQAKSMRKSQLKRILAKPEISDLLALHRAKASASGSNSSHVDFCDAYLRDQPDGPIDPAPLVTGHDLVSLGWKPGPHFATILEHVRDAQLEGEVQTKLDALNWIVNMRSKFID